MNDESLSYIQYNQGAPMIQCEITTRRWGNSLGMIIPREIVDQEKIKENEQIRVLILKQNKPVKQSFGLLKKKTTKTTQEWKDELKKEIYNE